MIDWSRHSLSMWSTYGIACAAALAISSTDPALSAAKTSASLAKTKPGCTYLPELNNSVSHKLPVCAEPDLLLFKKQLLNYISINHSPKKKYFCDLMKLNFESCRTINTNKMVKFSQIPDLKNDLWNEGSFYIYFSGLNDLDQSDDSAKFFKKYQGHLFLGRLFLEKLNSTNNCLTNTQFDEFLKNNKWRTAEPSKFYRAAHFNYREFIKAAEFKTISLVQSSDKMIYIRNQQSIVFYYTIPDVCVNQISYIF